MAKLKGKLTVINAPSGPRVAKLTAKLSGPAQALEMSTRVSPAEALYVSGDDRRAGQASQRCFTCHAFKREGQRRQGKCSKLHPTGKPVGRATVQANGYCSLYSPAATEAHKSASPRTIVPVERLRWGHARVIQTRNVTTLGVLAKAGMYAQVAPAHGSSPRWETPPIPDYADIYFQPESDKRNKLHRAHQENRRAANAQRNAGVYGFHGEANKLDRQLRYEPEESLSQPMDVVAPKRIGAAGHKATLIAPKLAPRLTAGRTTLAAADEDTGDEPKRRKRKKRKRYMARLR